MNLVETYTKNIYGTDLVYIKDPTTAKAVETLTGRKTLTDRDLDALAVLGITIYVKTP